MAVSLLSLNTMLRSQRPTALLVPLSILAIFILFSLISSRNNLKVPYLSTSHGNPLAHATYPQKIPKGNLDDVKNSTLGFQKVFVVNLSDRSDKFDAITLASSLTGFKIDRIDGVRGKTVPDKALPATFDRKGGDDDGRESVIGCWRAHMNAVQNIVLNRISSALIIEDDSDWDVSFKDQLVDIARGSRYISNTSADSAPLSPYGDGWDLLWLGHCGSSFLPSDNRRFVIENDPTVTPHKRRVNYDSIPDMAPYDNTTRIVYAASRGVCLYAYALSYRGAQKLLYHLSMRPFNNPIDLGMRQMCQDESRGFKCVGVFPQVIDSHRPAGPIDKDSDIATRPDQVRDHGMTFNIVHSTRLNVEHLMDGDMDAIESQWPTEIPKLHGGVRTKYQ